MNFGSAWQLQWGANLTNNTFKIPDYPNLDGSGIHKQYVFGADPVWKGASNELLYYNSVKMKMSVIIGVIQMSLGIFLHLLNAIHFKHWLDIFGEFIPRIIFLWAIFGYLCFMIFFKWGTDYAYQDYQIKQLGNQTIPPHLKGSQKAPVLLNEMIFMILPGGAPDNLYAGQSTLQTALVVIALLMVPIMMCLKPIHFKCCRKRDEPKYVNKVQVSHDHDEEESESERYTELGGNAGGGHGHGDDFSELMVHQILETIEFVLGSVSHTASYLRLWALSLAHSELATVFWDKVVFMLIEYTVGVNWFVVGLGTFAAHSVWFFVTFLVMMFMEGLSAFLHALRLHWVEFQSKFYKGDGHEFQPFSYVALEQPKE